jgi:hypothetical protein
MLVILVGLLKALSTPEAGRAWSTRRCCCRYTGTVCYLSPRMANLVSGSVRSLAMPASHEARRVALHRPNARIADPRAATDPMLANRRCAVLAEAIECMAAVTAGVISAYADETGTSPEAILQAVLPSLDQVETSLPAEIVDAESLEDWN